MLKIENLCYTASGEGEEKEIIKNLSLSLQENSFSVITGPNGGGKTTLAKLIMGLEKPTSGRIFWDGQEITGMSITERAKLGVSYGFQQPPRFKGITVYDLLKIASGRDMTRMECCDYLTQVGLCARDYVDRDMDDSLSGGEAKRIEIATILARRKGLLIFDEPEAGIDLWSFSKLADTFGTIREARDATLIVISHQERLIALADEIILIEDGQVAAQGSTEEIYPKITGQTFSACARMKEEPEC